MFSANRKREVIPYERKRQCEGRAGICRNHARPDEAGTGTQGGAGEDQEFRHVADHRRKRHGGGGYHCCRAICVRHQNVLELRRPDADGESRHRRDRKGIPVADRGCGEAGTRNQFHGETSRRGHDGDGAHGFRPEGDRSGDFIRAEPFPGDRDGAWRSR